MYPSYGGNIPTNASFNEFTRFMGVPTYMQNSAQMPVRGKLVTCIEEVEAVSIPLDGSITYYPRSDGKVIYTKYLDMNGNAVIVPYTRGNQAQPTKVTLDERVSKLEELVKQLKGDVDNGPDAVDSVNAELK